MKILWITNVAIGDLYQHLSGSRTEGGGWMDALLAAMRDMPDITLAVATIGRTHEVFRMEKDGITYHLLPAKNPLRYEYQTKHHRLQWQDVLHREQPDLIQIWGTEYAHGLTVANIAGNIPTVIYMQGILDTVVRYYTAGMSLRTICAHLTVRDITHLSGVLGEQWRYAQRAVIERALIHASRRIICENTWCRAHCRAIDDECQFYQAPLPVNTVFSQYHWSAQSMQPHTILTCAASYPLKGLHILIKAVGLLHRRFPDIQVLVPGMTLPTPRTIWQRMNEQGYYNYLRALIHDEQLEDHITFLGKLSAEEMAKTMAGVNVCVIPSAVENHSSTLKEAMMVGTPSIAAYVGGIPEYVTHGDNGLLYRFEEYAMLAERLCEVFLSPVLADTLSQNGHIAVRQLHDPISIARTMADIYRKVLRTVSPNRTLSAES